MAYHFGQTKMQKAGDKAYRKRIENIVYEAESLMEPAAEKFSVLASEYLNLQETFDIDMSVPGILAREISKTTMHSFCQFGDRNNITPGMILFWFRKKAISVDLVAISTELTTGISITPQDVVDFITEHPNGIGDYWIYRKMSELEYIAKDVFNVNLNLKVARWFA